MTHEIGRAVVLVAAVVVCASSAQAECVERGIWHKEVYCTPDPGEDIYVPPDFGPQPTVAELVATLVADARAQIQSNNLLGAWTQVETALRMKGDDPAALAVRAEIQRLIAEQEKRAAQERLNARVYEVMREAERIAATGDLQRAYDKAAEASALNAANHAAYDLKLRYKAEIMARAETARVQRAAANRAAYEAALKRAAVNTQTALTGLAQRLQGKAWAQAETAVAVARETAGPPADSGQDLIDDRDRLQVPFDRLDGILSGPALERLGAGPKAKPVAASREERIGRLIDQIDYLEGERRRIDAAIKSEADTVKQGKLRTQLAVVKALKATARTKLMDFSIKGPAKP